jgi:hypothetical protein
MQISMSSPKCRVFIYSEETSILNMRCSYELPGDGIFGYWRAGPVLAIGIGLFARKEDRMCMLSYCEPGGRFGLAKPLFSLLVRGFANPNVENLLDYGYDKSTPLGRNSPVSDSLEDNCPPPCGTGR